MVDSEPPKFQTAVTLMLGVRITFFLLWHKGNFTRYSCSSTIFVQLLLCLIKLSLKQKWELVHCVHPVVHNEPGASTQWTKGVHYEPCIIKQT